MAWSCKVIKLQQGLSEWALELNEVSEDSLKILGDGGHIAFRNMRFSKADFSDVAPAKQVTPEDAIPMSTTTGKPQINLIDIGKKLFC